MKKIPILIIITFLLVLTGCSSDYDEYCYEINYIEEYNNGSFIINDVKELQTFYKEYNEIFGLDNIEKQDKRGFKNIYGFYDIYDKYESTGYFNDGKRLILIVLNEGYDATKHRLVSVKYTDDTANIVVECSLQTLGSNVPSVCGACLMIIEVNSDEPYFDNVQISRLNKK